MQNFGFATLLFEEFRTRLPSTFQSLSRRGSQRQAMQKVTVPLDQETSKELLEQAAREKRPVKYQAEVALRRGLGINDAK